MLAPCPTCSRPRSWVWKPRSGVGDGAAVGAGEPEAVGCAVVGWGLLVGEPLAADAGLLVGAVAGAALPASGDVPGAAASAGGGVRKVTHSNALDDDPVRKNASRTMATTPAPPARMNTR